jgi:hypothetical protein
LTKPNPAKGVQDPLTPALSKQARLGELATQRRHIRKRIWRGEGALLHALRVNFDAVARSIVLSPLGERDRVKGDLALIIRV